MKGIVNVELHKERGLLGVIENLPIEVKRVFFMKNGDNTVSRGNHAHFTLTEIVFCLQGSVKITLDDGKSTEETVLNSPDKGIFIDSWVWRKLSDFEKDTILLVLASEQYDPDDYIYDYNEFLKGVHDTF